VDFWELAQEAELKYIYVRKDTTGIQAQSLVACDGLQKLYDNEDVSIWLIDSYNSDVVPDDNEDPR